MTEINKFYLSNSIQEIKSLILNGEISCQDLADITINQMQAFEGDVKAWVSFDYENLLLKSKLSDERYRMKNPRFLEGVPYGAKDIFNTKEFPTQMGSDLWSNFNPGNDARVVEYLNWAGANLVGKTNTAEFAVHHLNETINPHNESLTPGTSSSGSAASVAAGMIPFALATQTAGSITRPASFCGVWGFKPSFGLVPRTGVLKTTDSLDTVGFIAAHGSSLRQILDSIRVYGPNYPFVHKNIDKAVDIKKGRYKIGFVKTHVWMNAKPYAREAIEKFLVKISMEKNFDVEEVLWPSELNMSHDIHEIIYSKSLSYYFEREGRSAGKISDVMKQMIEAGNQISMSFFQGALNEQSKIIKITSDIFKEYDAIISIGTGSSAPPRGEIEVKDPSLIWTLAHLPTVSVPLFRSPEGMPFSIQFTGKKWGDYSILEVLETLIQQYVVPDKSTEIIKKLK
uniref:amidase n=2 Tax=Polynucleobacter sp. TaxID=2029855 RepID=UPI00404751FB